MITDTDEGAWFNSARNAFLEGKDETISGMRLQGRYANS